MAGSRQLRVLVTGGLGYIGGRLCHHLIQKGYDLAIHSRRTSGLPQWAAGSVFNHDPADECRKEDVVIHLAGPNEIDAAADSKGERKQAAESIQRILAAAETASVQNFIFFSTIHVYGAPLEGVIDEGRPPSPSHPYGAINLDGENFVQASKLKTLVFRLSNVIGAPISPDINRWTLIGNDLCRQAVETGKLTLHTPGQQRRDFIAMGDVVAAVSHFLERQDWGEGLFQLGGGRSLSILELAEVIASRCPSVLGFTPSIKRPEATVNQASPILEYRIERLTETGFIPAKNLSHEIDATLAFCKSAFAST